MELQVVVRREIQSVEVSCFVHATEDETKVQTAVKGLIGVEAEPTSERLEGHYGNAITHLTWHLTGEDAWSAFVALARHLGEEERETVLGDLESHTDEHGALYIRLSKQSVVTGSPLLSSGDPLRIRVKPRRFMMKEGGPTGFYRRLVDEAGAR